MKTPAQPMAMRTRILVWVPLCAVFVLLNLSRIVFLLRHGQPVPWVIYLQAALWIPALAFWAWAGWREWQRSRGAKAAR